MSMEPEGYHHRGIAISWKIRTLLRSLRPSTYDEVSPKIEYWIEHALTEQSIDTNDLVGRLSSSAWDGNGPESNAAVVRFLKDFRDAPHRSERSRSLVDGLCSRILWWFTAASAEDLLTKSDHRCKFKKVAVVGGEGFVLAASFVGYLIEQGLLSQDHVRRHLIKSLTAHHYYSDRDKDHKTFRAAAIYQLLVAAGNTLLQGLLEPEDVQVCFETLNSQIPLGGVVGLDAVKLAEFRGIHTTWLEQEERRRGDAAETEERRGEVESVMTAEVLAEVETPVAFAPQDLPTTIDIGIPPPNSHGFEFPFVLHDVRPPSDPLTDDQTTAASSPTSSVSTISDLTPTELGTGEGGDERMTTRHDTFYFEDGNVEIVCGHTLFRVHSATVSFSSLKLREILSQSSLLHVPMPEGCPRIIVPDTAQDFSVLLKMIHTPGFPAWRKVPEFTVFASLLRMTTKYGFSDVRDQLVDSIKAAYPTKWEGSGTAKVLGEDTFGSPKPHPNAVLNLFLEQKIKFALPFAAYRAALGGLTSLTNNTPGTVLPPLTLASTIYGMETIRGGLTHLAHFVVCNMSLEECRDGACAVNVCVGPPSRRIEELNKLYETMVKEGKGDVLFSLSLGNIVCANCAKIPKKAYHTWRTVIWEELPLIFGIGKSWDDL